MAEWTLRFQHKLCGFFVDQETSYLGASPALVGCSCCGFGVLEVPLCMQKMLDHW